MQMTMMSTVSRWMSTGPGTSGPQLKSSNAQVILYLDFNNLDFYHGKRGLRRQMDRKDIR